MDALKFFHTIIEGKLYLANSCKSGAAGELHYFKTKDYLEYSPLCDDFGPLNISSVARFMELLEDEAKFNKSKKIVYLVDRGRRPTTNGAFLVGAYLVLKLDFQPEDVLKIFKGLDPDIFEPFRDATFAPVDFGLSLLDCWRAIRKAMTLGWFRPAVKPGLWGLINIDEYDHYEDPLNADLVEVSVAVFISSQY